VNRDGAGVRLWVGAQNVWLVGAGSGHGFKHGPEVGRLAADLVLGDKAAAEPRFSLATKARHHHRRVY
jgi:glycine/D-amino acid oxidase-like deaminating enzyme